MSARYIIAFQRDWTPFDFTVVGQATTLDDARETRVVSGDLVFDSETGKIVSHDDTWLWEWERRDPRCYAKRMMANGRRLACAFM